MSEHWIFSVTWLPLKMNKEEALKHLSDHFKRVGTSKASVKPLPLVINKIPLNLPPQEAIPLNTGYYCYKNNSGKNGLTLPQMNVRIKALSPEKYADIKVYSIEEYFKQYEKLLKTFENPIKHQENEDQKLTEPNESLNRPIIPTSQNIPKIDDSDLIAKKSNFERKDAINERTESKILLRRIEKLKKKNCDLKLEKRAIKQNLIKLQTKNNFVEATFSLLRIESKDPILFQDFDFINNNHHAAIFDNCGHIFLLSVAKKLLFEVNLARAIGTDIHPQNLLCPICRTIPDSIIEIHSLTSLSILKSIYFSIEKNLEDFDFKKMVPSREYCEKILLNKFGKPPLIMEVIEHIIQEDTATRDESSTWKLDSLCRLILDYPNNNAIYDPLTHEYRSYLLSLLSEFFLYSAEKETLLERFMEKHATKLLIRLTHLFQCENNNIQDYLEYFSQIEMLLRTYGMQKRFHSLIEKEQIIPKLSNRFRDFPSLQNIIWKIHDWLKIPQENDDFYIKKKPSTLNL